MATIQVDHEKRKLIIRAQGPDEGSVLLKLPSRRWMPKLGKFVVPMTKANVKLLLEAARQDRFEIRDAEGSNNAGLWDTLEGIANSGPGSREFPKWYTYKLQPRINQAEALQKAYKNDVASLLMRMGCFSGDTEYLTPTGWRRFDAYEGGYVAQWVPGISKNEGKIEFIKPSRYLKVMCNDWYQLQHSKGLDQVVDGKHRVVYWDGGVKESTAPELMKRGTNSFQVPALFRTTGGPGVPFTDDQIRIMVAICADGRFPKNAPGTKRVAIDLFKLRKQKRIRYLLTKAGIPWDESKLKTLGRSYVSFKFEAPIREKRVGADWWWGASNTQMDTLFDEVFKWDGHEYSSGRKAFYSKFKEDVDFVQFLATTRGRRARVSINRGQWHCEVRKNNDSLNIRGINIRRLKGKRAYKYGFTVPSSYLVVRRNDKISVSGNTGKSKVIIDYQTAQFYERLIHAVVLICPLTVTAVWGGEGGELAKHSPCPVKTHFVDSSFDASKAWREIEATAGDTLHWFLVGVESLSQGRTFDRLLPFIQNTAVGMAVDEASRIKNWSAIRTKRVIDLGKSAKNRIIATGTIVTKNLMDLYAPYQFLDPNIIGVGDYYAFRNRYAIMGGFKRKEVVGYDNVEELMGLIEPYTYICDKPRGMPKQQWVERIVQLTNEQKEVYRKIRNAEMEGVTVANVLSKMLRLQQVVGGFYSDDPKKEINPLTGRIKKVAGVNNRIISGASNPKIKALHEIMEEADRPVIIWARFKFEIGDIMEAMKSYGRVAVMTGDTEIEDRMKIKDDFQAGKYEVMVGNQTVGGIGLTLTRAHVMVYYSNTDSLEDRLQSEDRIHRDGQEDDCLYIDLIAEKTVDRVKQGAIAAKKDLDVYVRDKIREAGGRAEALFGDV